MEPRYSLRFENGERKGETIPVPDSGLTVGRKPGNTLQIVDNSVSGSHAELAVDKFGVTVKDTGSTNGTRVNGERVLEQRLAQGDALAFGTVELAFTEIGAPVGAPAAFSASIPQAGGGEGLERISPELLARSRKVSKPGILVFVLAVAGAGVWWWLNRSARAPEATVKPVEVVPGNLLGDESSFEAERDSWSGAEGAPQAFLRSPRAAATGLYGMGTELGPDEWARARSKAVAAPAEKELVARASLRAGEGVRMRVGLEFGHAAADPGLCAPFIAWSRPAEEGSGAGAVEIAADVPPGYDRACVVVDARSKSGARADFDDVSLLVRGPASKPAAEAGEARLLLHGDPHSLGLLARGARVLFSALEFVREGEAGAVSIAARADGARILVVPAPGEAASRHLSLLVDGDLAREGIASLGAEKSGKDSGYRSHGAGDFERAGVGTLLFGTGHDLVALRCGAPFSVKAVREESGVRVALEFAEAPAELALQTDFRDERREAGNVAHDARAAERKGDLGECLRLWKSLLDDYPFEELLVKEAEEARSRLVQQGLSELRLVRADIERAKFFRLPELYQRCRDRALAIGTRYAGSEVDGEAHESRPRSRAISRTRRVRARRPNASACPRS
ncbi:MAG: FHA domain-containing protein [Planctomycetes bacterium]|nr:FHA domain-containing protein [Planctomycetota bacterium]